MENYKSYIVKLLRKYLTGFGYHRMSIHMFISDL